MAKETANEEVKESYPGHHEAIRKLSRAELRTAASEASRKAFASGKSSDHKAAEQAQSAAGNPHHAQTHQIAGMQAAYSEKTGAPPRGYTHPAEAGERGARGAHPGAITQHPSLASDGKAANHPMNHVAHGGVPGGSAADFRAKSASWFKAPEAAQRAVLSGPRGGRYMVGPGGHKVYLGKSG